MRVYLNSNLKLLLGTKIRRRLLQDCHWPLSYLSLTIPTVLISHLLLSIYLI